MGASEGFLGWIAYLGAANAGIPLSIIVKNYGWEVRRLPRRHSRARQLSQRRRTVCRQYREVLCVMPPMCSALCAYVCLGVHHCCGAGGCQGSEQAHVRAGRLAMC